MKNRKVKVWKLVLGILFVIIFIVLFFASTVLKHWIQKNSESLIGRKVSIEAIHVNYLKIAVEIDGFVLFEKNNEEVFVSFDELYVNFDPINLLFRNEYKFSKIRLIEPYVYVAQNEEDFNFSDMIPEETVDADSVATIEADSVKTTEVDSVETTKESEPFKFTIKNIKISRGNIVYNDRIVEDTLNIDNLSLNVPVISWNNQQSNVGLNFNIGEDGLVNIRSKILPTEELYTVKLKIENINIEIIKNYLEDYLKIDDFSGLLSTDLAINGSLNDYTNIFVSGKATVDSLFITDKNKNHLLSCDNVSTLLSNIDLKNYSFHIASVDVSNPCISAILYDDYTNIEKVLGYDQIGDNQSDTIYAEEFDTLNTVAETDEMEIKYRVDTFTISNGDLRFDDSTLNRTFSYMVHSIGITATNIADDATEVPVTFSMQPIPSGSISGKMLLNLKDTRYANLILNVKKLDLTSFSPYSEYYIASPINKGALNYDMEFDLTPTELQNSNEIYINNLEFGEKTSDSTAVKVPIKLALYVMKDKDDKITIDLPVSGDPSDPEYKYTKLLWKTLSQLLIKVSTAPLSAMGNLVSINPDEIKEIAFDYNQNTLTEDQKEALDAIKTLLENKPDIVFILEQYTNIEEEKKLAAVYLAKKEYVLSVNKKADNNIISSISVDNISFQNYVNTKNNTTNNISTEEACLKLYTEKELVKVIIGKMQSRNKLFKSHFDNSVSDRVKFTTPDLKNSAEAKKRPHYQVEVDTD